MMDAFQTDTNRNFPEDYDQENGNYVNTCKDCRLPFRGNKHRIWCKMCEEPNWDELSKIQRPDGPTVIPGAWIQGEMVGYSRCMVKRVKPLLEQLSSKEQELQDANGIIAASGRNIFDHKQEIENLRKRCEDLEAALRESLPWAIGSGHGISEELEMRCQKLLSQ